MDREPGALASELMVCLGRQAEALNQFLELLARQQAALVSPNPREVDKVTLELEQVVSHSHRLESTRKALTARLVACLKHEQGHASGDAGPGATTLAELSGLVAASEASELLAVQSRLRALHKEIDRRRRLNRVLIEESLRCTGETLQWIVRKSQREPTYSQRGTPPQSPTQLAVNRRC